MFRPEKGNLAIVITFVAAFLIAFCVLWMERKSDASSPEANSTAVVAARDDGPGQPTPLIRSRQPSPPQTSTVRPIRAAAAPAARVDAASTTDNPSGAELPADINFRRRSGSDTYLEGSILNKSAEDLPIEVYFFNPQTKQTSKIELTVPANHASAFGRDDGLEIEGGDAVTIKNPAYAEKHVEVR